MRIFCPAMVVGRPLLPAAHVRVLRVAHTWRSPALHRLVSLRMAPVHEVGRVAPCSQTGSRITRVPLGGRCARGSASGPGARGLLHLRAPGPTHNPSRMPHVSVAPSTGGYYLLVDLRDLTGTDGAPALADGELQALLHGDRLDQRDADRGVVARHDHLGAAGQGHDARHVRGAEVELRAVVVEERRVTAALVLGQDVDLRLELRVRGDRVRLDDDLAALDVLALDTAEEQTHVLTRATLVEDLAEHLDTGDGGLGRLLADADDLDLLVHLHDAALDAAGDHGAATGDREDVLDGHEERLLGVALRLRDRLVDRVHELEQLGAPLGVALERLERRDTHDREV